MSTDTACLLALVVGGLGPALIIASKEGAGSRLVGVQLASSVMTACLLLFSQAGPGQSYDLIVPLVLVPLSFAGTLVFTRLLGHSRQEEGGSVDEN